MTDNERRAQQLAKLQAMYTHGFMEPPGGKVTRQEAIEYLARYFEHEKAQEERTQRQLQAIAAVVASSSRAFSRRQILKPALEYY